MTSTDFCTTLQSLTQAVQRARSTRRRAPARVSPTPSRALARLEIVERLEELLVPYFETLTEDLPALRRRRRFFDGKWLMGVTADVPRTGRLRGSACTRLDFTIETLDDGERVAVTSFATVLDVELPKWEARVAWDHSASDTLDAMIETACLAFVQRYLEDVSPRAATDEASTPHASSSIPDRL